MLSKLVNDTDGPDGPMAPAEAAANAQLLLIAGHDSTVNTIAHCVLLLLRNPESIDLLREKPELIPKAIEEVLRLQSAVQFFPSRSVTADVEVGGTVIPAGSAVHLLYGAANRDPKRFPDPEKFDIQRKDNQHVGWGRGVHSCVGGPLARLEVNIAVETFLRRVENPRLVVDPPPYRHEPGVPRSAASRGRVRPDQGRLGRAKRRGEGGSEIKAFQFVEWQQPGQLRDVPVPEPGPGEVLVKVGGAGACHSDLHLLEAPAGIEVVHAAVHPRPRERRLGRDDGAGRNGFRSR